MVIGLVAALPAIQLVPLPPAVWQSLSGREFIVESLALANIDGAWHPLSIAPHRTFAALVALLVPLALLAIAAKGTGAMHRNLMAVIIGGGLTTAVLGTLQMAAPGSFRFYSASHDGWITGLFANRNAAADFLVIALGGLVAFPALMNRTRLRGLSLVAMLGIAAMLVVATILTGSRTGIGLLVVPLALAIWLWAPGRGRFAKWRSLALVPIALVIVGALLATAGSGPLARVATRFRATEDFRSELWIDSWFALEQSWPFGVGMGNFVPAFLPAERLEAVDPTMPNRAHNDFLELLVEAGGAGIVVLIAVAAILLGRVWIGIRNTDKGSAERAALGFAVATLTVVGLHSLVDYPLRNMALASIAGVAAGIVLAYPIHAIRPAAGGKPAREGI